MYFHVITLVFIRLWQSCNHAVLSGCCRKESDSTIFTVSLRGECVFSKTSLSETRQWREQHWNCWFVEELSHSCSRKLGLKYYFKLISIDKHHYNKVFCQHMWTFGIFTIWNPKKDVLSSSYVFYTAYVGTFILRRTESLKCLKCASADSPMLNFQIWKQNLHHVLHLESASAFSCMLSGNVHQARTEYVDYFLNVT